MDSTFQHVQMAAEGKIQSNFIDITSVTVQRRAGKAGFEQGEALSRTPPPSPLPASIMLANGGGVLTWKSMFLLVDLAPAPPGPHSLPPAPHV